MPEPPTIESRLARLEAEAAKRKGLGAVDFRIPLLATGFDIEAAVFPPKVFAYRSATQTIPTADGTALALNVELFDTDSMHDNATNNTRITFRTAGTYVVDLSSSWAADPANAYIKILKNGTSDLKLQQIVGDYRSMSLTAIRDFVVGDYIEMIVFQNSGGDLATIAAAGKYSTFSAVWVAP